MPDNRITTTLPEWVWFRECTVCGNVQTDEEPNPPGHMTDAYRNRRCRACRSEALDYGKVNHTESW